MHKGGPTHRHWKAELRRRAELEVGDVGDTAALDAAQARQLVRDLRVAQAELELQSDELFAARRECEQLRDRYLDLFELAPIGFVVTDTSGHIVEANWVAATMLGRLRAELIGRSLSSLVDLDDAESVQRHLQHVQLLAVRRSCEARVTGTGGAHVIVRLESVALCERDEPILVRTAIIDETERRRAEQSLRERESRLRAVFDTVPDAIVTVDERGQVEGFNAAAERVFGYRAAEMAGRSAGLLLAPPYCDDHVAHLERAIGRWREIAGVRKDGSVFPLELGVGEHRGSGRRHIAVMRDVSERVRLEAELRQAHKMEALGRLAAGIAHDFNNVLMGMVGCTDAALAKLEHPGAARSYLLEVKEAATSGAAIVRQLMTFSRRELPEPTCAALDAIVRHSVTLLQPLLGEEVRLELALSAGAARVRTARGQIEQVLVNLAANARDAMPQGGTLRIESAVGTQPVSELGDDALLGSYVMLAVHDTGCGMDDRTRGRALEPFFTTKGPEHGTGLGLSTVYAIVRQLGGLLELDSDPGLGTRVRIFLPCADAVEDLTAHAAPSSQSAVGETILLVEDDPRVRLGVRLYLERAGYRVLEAGDGIEALRRAEEASEPIDLLLTDVVLPAGMSGVEIAKQLSARIAGLSVLIMSAHSHAALARRFELPGGTPLVCKPFAEAELLRAVRDALRERRAASEAPTVPLESTERPTPPERGTVLLVEDERASRLAIRWLLEQEGYRVLEAASLQAALHIASTPEQCIDVLLTDLNLPDGRGDCLAVELQERRPDLAVLIMSACEPSEDAALARALERPRTDFIAKPVELGKIGERVEIMSRVS